MSAEEFSLREFANRLDEQSSGKQDSKLTAFLRNQLLSQLNKLELGSLDVIEGDITHTVISDNPS